jgi:hypothetical protein
VPLALDFAKAKSVRFSAENLTLAENEIDGRPFFSFKFV